MDRLKVLHNDEEWYVLFITRPGVDHTKVVVRGLESVSASHIRINVPQYKRTEIDQLFQNQFGPTTEVQF